MRTHRIVLNQKMLERLVVGKMVAAEAQTGDKVELILADIGWANMMRGLIKVMPKSALR